MCVCVCVCVCACVPACVPACVCVCVFVTYHVKPKAIKLLFFFSLCVMFLVIVLRQF